ncbi:hypothetical protein Hanom_Chr08g00706041 [Helianthus anomalus]
MMEVGDNNDGKEDDLGGGSVEASDSGSNVQRQDSTVEIQGIQVNVHEVFSQHIQERGHDGETRKKRGSHVHKKVARSKSNSPLGQERPKKRQRDSGDPFDVDKFIFQTNGIPKGGYRGREFPSG